MKKQSKLLGLLFLFAFTGLISCKGKEETKGTDGDKKNDVVSENIEKTKTFYPMFEKADWSGIEKIVSADFKDHSSMGDPNAPSNRDSLINGLKAFHDAFPDMKFEVLHVAGVDDMVFVHYRFTGTNSGAMMGMPATNKKVDYMGVDLVKIKDGVATEHWDYGDNISFMKQMGMMPGN